MSTSSKIQWTDATWNPTVGCSPVSEGCRNCYAAREAIRLAGNPSPAVGELYAGTSDLRGAGSARHAVFTGIVRTAPDRLEAPLRWGRPRRVFVDSMSDLFHEDVPDEYLDRVFAVMALSPRHTFQVLTKRPERMADYMDRLGGRLDALNDHAATFMHWDDMPTATFPLANVWLGTSVENQAAADERIPHLLSTPAAVRFLSCEPLLGPLELRQAWRDYLEGWDSEPTHVCGGDEERCARLCPEVEQFQTPRVDWVIVGGESGPGARPCDVAWVRSVVEQCRSAKVPAFVKQLGRWITGDYAAGFSGLDRWLLEDGAVFVPPIIGPHTHTRPRDAIAFSIGRKAGDPEDWPADLRVREFPEEVTP
ncbi:MAG: phage Gp37/Gp68 family protein [Thermoleophilia bacterium]|nr:phage Gp37/Gp68 family protein [Thermoleophilia bacterium]